MCRCGKPTINGEPDAYSWDGRVFSTRQADPPKMVRRDQLIFDEAGRCAGMDAHAYHFRLVKNHDHLFLLVKHGAGQEVIHLPGTANLILPALYVMDSNARFWMFRTIHGANRDGFYEGSTWRDLYWTKAAVDGRIRVRKVWGSEMRKVTVLPQTEKGA